MPYVRMTFKGSKVEIKTEGFVGKACQQATDPYVQALGLTGMTDEKTTEYYQEAHVEQQAGGNDG